MAGGGGGGGAGFGAASGGHGGDAGVAGATATDVRGSGGGGQPGTAGSGGAGGIGTGFTGGPGASGTRGAGGQGSLPPKTYARGGGGGGSSYADPSVTGVTTSTSSAAASVTFVYMAPAISSAPQATFGVGATSSFTVTAGGVPGGPTLKISDGGATLPAGVTFVDNGDGTATLSGTPAAGSGGTYALTITANNGVSPAATQKFTLTVTEPPAITSGAQTTFTVGTAGAYTVTTMGFPTGPTLKISDGGAIRPAGVTFADNGDGTATLSGTPAAGSGGTYPFTITANNGLSPAATQSFTLTVGTVQPSLTVTANPTNVTQGNPVTFTARVTAPGSTGPEATGTVSFSDAPIAGCQNIALVSGVASCTTSAPPVGTDPVTATYSGDGTFASGTASVSVVVSPPAAVPVPSTGSSWLPALPVGGLPVAFGAGCLWIRRRVLRQG